MPSANDLGNSMYIQEEFITDEDELLKFSNKESWADQFQHQTMWYEGWWKREPENVWEETVRKIWEPLKVDQEKTHGFEFWINVLPTGGFLNWHQDKDEMEANDTGKVITPKKGTLYYPVPHVVSGGYLEVQNEQHEIERIAPAFNRLIIFDSSLLHRVSPVYHGPRFVFITNLWEGHTPKAFQPT